MAINTWAIPVLRYGAGIVNWSKAEMENMDRKTRKRITICGMLHPRASVDRLYLSRRCGGRGLKDCIRAEEIQLSKYIQKCEEPLLVAVRNENFLGAEEDATVEHFKERNRKKRQEDRRAKALHGQILRQTEDVRDGASWDWMMRET